MSNINDIDMSELLDVVRRAIAIDRNKSSNTGDNNDEDQLSGDGGSRDMVSMSKNECASDEQSGIDNITKGIDSVANDMSTCANCGKEGNSDDMNTCNKCNMIKYCNAACKKKHRKKHKKACSKRVAELHDEALFNKEPPPREECPICMIPLPFKLNESTFFPCCCNKREEILKGKIPLCPFCKEPTLTSDEHHIKQISKLVDNNNAKACNVLGDSYSRGVLGLTRDYRKANELFLKAGELGCADGYRSLGDAYDRGIGVEADQKKAKYYYELAALNGSVTARSYLSGVEGRAFKFKRAIKHLLIAAQSGDEESLGYVKLKFSVGMVTKDEYANTLRAYHEKQKETWSDARDKAAAAGLFS